MSSSFVTAARASLVLIVSYMVFLASSYGGKDGWLIEADGHKSEVEFVGVKAAGDLVLAGRAVDAYDPKLHRKAYEAAVGREKIQYYYAWPYPPQYLSVAALLALMPYVASALALIFVTMGLYAWAAVRITGLREAALWAVASPATFINMAVAHTGFLVAGLFGIGLAALPASPVAAGAAFGLLAIKPQLGLMIPIALAGGRHWRAMIAAAVTIAVTVLASMVLFGIDPWIAFFPQIDRVAEIFRSGKINMLMMVTVYGFMRNLGLAHAPAIAVQCAATLAIAVTVFRLWRSDAPYELKAAGLAVASVLATPYLFPYDLTLLTVALLFVVRQAGPAMLDETEKVIVLVCGLCLLFYSVMPFQVGLLANIATGAIVYRRWRRWAVAQSGDSIPSASPLSAIAPA